MVVLKILLFILLPFFVFSQDNVHDLTNELASKLGGWSIGNACGVDFLLKGVIKGDLDMQNEPLELLNSHLIVEGVIINSGTIVYLCDNSILEVKGEVLAIENPVKPTLKIYPNPAEYEINIKGIEVSTIELFDMVGRRLKHFKTVGISHKIMVDDLQMGIYILKINGNLTHKIVKL